MDKYEFRVKTEEIENLTESGDYLSASKIADTIDWNKVKSVSMLCNVADIYDKIGKFAECKEVLLMAYSRSPLGRMIVYKLSEISIKLKNLDEAEEYYKEFLEVAPRDSHKFILRYQLQRAKDASNEELINILEDLKANEFTEKWAYELAYLYHKTGLITKCVEECDEIFLWFGQGKYVEKALELKMLYEPLTQIQKERYEESRLSRSKAILSAGENNPEDGEEDDSPIIKPVEICVSKFNTNNLQEELARNMQQIMNATERETVSESMSNIKKLVEDSHIPQINFEGIVLEKNISNESLDDLIEEKPSMSKADKHAVGQMSIDDVLADWENKKLAAQHALKREEEKNFESAKANAIKQTKVLMEQLSSVIPELEKQQTEIKNEIKIREQQQKKEFEQMQEKRIQKEKEGPAVVIESDIKEFTPEVIAGIEKLANNPVIKDIVEKVIPSPEVKKEDEVNDAEKTDTPELEQTEGIKVIVDEETNEVIKVRTEVKPPQVEEELIFIKKENRGRHISAFHMEKEQKKVFTYFMQVRGMEEQLNNLFYGIKKTMSRKVTSETGNIIVTGNEGSGKTKLATDLIKVLKKMYPKKSGKVGKISGSILNSKKVSTIFSKLDGGFMIIEKAGDISYEKVQELSLVMEGITHGVTVILEDEVSAINKILVNNMNFTKKFSEHVNIPKFNNDELIEFAREYARENKYEIEEMGVLALYNRLGNIQFDESATSLDEVIEILDKAMENASKVGLSKKIEQMFSKKPDTNPYTIIKEKDFELN